MDHPIYKHGQVLHVDRAAGTRAVYYDIDEDQGAIVTEMLNQSELLDANTELRNDTANTRFGDLPLVASVPMHLAEEILFPALKNHDDAFVKKWLNDSDNIGFRTRGGQL